MIYTNSYKYAAIEALLDIIERDGLDDADNGKRALKVIV